MDFTGKTIIVTGAGGGIGEGYAKACSERGMNVVIAELSEEGGQRVADEINAGGGSALFVKTDVGCEDSTKACAKAVMDKFGAINYLINNAAIFGDMKIEGYVGVPLHDSQGEVIGIIVALHENEINNANFIKTLFELFSGRIAVEMERNVQEKNLKQLNKKISR